MNKTEIQETDLSSRIKRCLHAGDISTIEEMKAAYESGELARYRNLGEKSLREIKMFLWMRNLCKITGTPTEYMNNTSNK